MSFYGVFVFLSMEVGLEGEKKKKPPEGENKTKRKMKTASQLEILEKTYAEEAYPPESLRAELSVKLGLSDRQLQMWFCHRRLKDRKATLTLTSGKRPRKDSQAAAVVAGGSGEETAAGDLGNEHASRQRSGPIPFGHAAELPRIALRHWEAGPRAGGDMPPHLAMKRHYEPQQTIAELRAIAFVEAQLGEPLREDGPILGMEFDPLPPDAFGMPIGAAILGQHKQTGRPFDAKIYDRLDAKAVKGAARALHEYQFIPEQPIVRTDAYERRAPSYRYGSPADVPNARTSSLSTGHMYLHGNEHLSSGYGIQGQITGLNQLPQQGRENHFLPSASGQHDTVQRKNLLTNTSTDAYLGTHPINQLENPFIAPDKWIINEEDNARIERKRKSEEARLAREVEAHEKRIRKELEKQDVLRRKREEQIRKEMERHDRERRKEEERLLREKRREEERYQREQRRELERREKFLQKESIRAEKMRQQEELRREKEGARLRAAHQRAITRRIAKESMELIEDERLELMELAASSKRLPSILSLDYEILQNLELYRDLQIAFPPKSLHLKKPFGIQPWTDSEDNIGSLLMAWRFLITFADILRLWPFTLDEFIQAFHDYDTRLLGEIHISLLRSIIKDIEDVARTPSTGLGANQTSTANPGGGHPLIVEGAYAWGFDIRSWQRHLNPLTWPEILRQFALSAGFGPQLKKRNIEPSYLRDDNEGNDGKDIVSNLRSGAAVENAFAKMQERGFSNPHRSRHRLTPGTVKFAAFHVLSLEGERGLTILEVADRIQKSGLRDLTTSKTPEASISAALSRDTKLFERTAPSTYCVRAVYRKDPADAEAILSAARERIGTFKSGFLDGEDADDGERDEDSESDVAEDPDIDDLGTDVNPESNVQGSQEVNKLDLISLLENGKGSFEVNDMPEKGLQNIGASCVKTKDPYSSLGQSVDNIESCKDASVVDHEDADIDESNPGEPWVQGLIEGEYSDLSVEERLNALVAIIGVAVEGNSIRIVLEERLEAANALKKQMWAEMQLDKRRMKEEFLTRMHYSSAMVSKFETNLANISAEGRQSPFVTVDDKNNKTTDNLAVQEERISDALDESHRVSSFPSEGNLQMQEVSAGAENHVFHQPGYAVERSRSQLKSYVGHKAEEMYVYRSLPLGQDRRRNRYWQFITSASQNDPGCGRIFVELHDSRWRLIDSEEAFDALLASLDIRGVRESHLQMMLQNVEISFKKAVRKKMLHTKMRRQSEDTAKMEALEMTPHPRSSIGTDSPGSTLCIADSDGSETSTFDIELGRNKNESNGALKRYQDLERWIWRECCSSSMLCAIKQGKKRCKQLLDFCDDCHGIYSSEEDHCPSCHITCGPSERGIRFSEHVAQCKGGQNCSLHGSRAFPPRIRLLKILLALIEVSVPPEALQSLWTRSHRESWGVRLNTSSSAEDLLEVLMLLEGAVKREFLFIDFETTRELLDFLNPGRYAASSSASPETITVLPWVPRTTAAVALRVMEFDAAISYVLQQKVESQKDKGSDVIKLSSKHAFEKSLRNDETLQTPGQGHHFKEDYWAELGIGLAVSGNGRGIRGRGRGRTRGSRSQRRAIGSTSGDTAKKRNGILGQGLGWKGRQHGRGRKRGRRSVRSRQKPAKRIVQTGVVKNPPEENVSKKSPRSLVYRWNAADTTGFRLEGAEPVSSSGRSDYDDENGQGLGDDYEEMAMDDYASGFTGKSVDLEGSESNMDGVEEEVDGDYDEDEEGYHAGEGYDIGEEEQGDFDVDRYIYGYSEEEENRVGEGEQIMEPSQDTESSSSDYSE